MMSSNSYPYNMGRKVKRRERTPCLISRFLLFWGLCLAAQECLAAQGGTLITQYFPPDAKTEEGATTAWQMEWAFEPLPSSPARRGSKKDPSAAPKPHYLYVRNVRFMNRDVHRNPRWIPIADEIRIAELFVQYNGTEKHSSLAEFELSENSKGLSTLALSAAHPASFRKERLLQDRTGYALAEARYDDVRWMETYPGERISYAAKLDLWCTLPAEGYRYLIRYSFRDDGTIRLMVGATGVNRHRRAEDPRVLESNTHTHLACWKLDLSLGPNPEKNSLLRVSNDHDGNSGWRTEYELPVEGFYDFSSTTFDRLMIQGHERRSRNVPTNMSYDLLPSFQGQLRYSGKMDSHFASHDLWVTRPEATGGMSARYLADYVAKPESLKDSRRQLWINRSFLHIPRQEDFDHNGNNNTTALTAWSEVILQPRDMFDKTPFF